VSPVGFHVVGVTFFASGIELFVGAATAFFLFPACIYSQSFFLWPLFGLPWNRCFAIQKLLVLVSPIGLSTGIFTFFSAFRFFFCAEVFFARHALSACIASFR